MDTKDDDVGEPASTLRVAVVDDHTTFSDLLCLALNAEDDLLCVGTAGPDAARDRGPGLRPAPEERCPA